MRTFKMATLSRVKTSKEQRERLRARRKATRSQIRSRLFDEARLACYLYLGGSDGALTTGERTIIRRECGASHLCTVPSHEALSQRVRSFVTLCRPTLRDRRELMVRLHEFAQCDGALSPDEEEALRVIGDILQVSAAARRAQSRRWRSGTRGSEERGTSSQRSRPSSHQRSADSTRTRARVSQPPPPQRHWSYEYLGCSEQDTDETIKRCYRRLAVKLHPDKHASCSLTPEETLSHLRAFQRLQEAYEAVWKLRGASSSRQRT